MLNIAELPTYLAQLPRPMQRIAERLFAIEQTAGSLVIPASMEAWALQHFGDLTHVRTQTITRITNRYTLESAIFNPLRARRPAAVVHGEKSLEHWIEGELRHDIFGDPMRDTTSDLFGRISGKHCITAANIAKYAGWHGLVIPHEPHPLRFTEEQLADYLDVALRWIATVQQQDQQARYPLITWNCLPKSGATIVHSHWQIAIAQATPYARIELWRRAIAAYRSEYNANYIEDLCAIHRACGLHLLPVAQDQVPAIAHLTPLRSREILLCAPAEAGQPGHSATGSLATALYRALRMLIDQHGVEAFNMAIALPPMSEQWPDFPVLVRIGDRGPALTNRGDLGAMELYGTGVIAIDPYELVHSSTKHSAQ
jgi:hypothetical protein